jgi:DNA-binding NarL/FixJ family response regulator
MLTQNNRTVLIIEDFDQIRNCIGQVFVNHGYKVVSCGTLNNAIIVATEEATEIIIYDFKMKAYDPYVAIAVLHSEFPDSKIIILNAELPRYQDRIMSLGLSKIILPSYNVAAIEKILSEIEHQELSSVLMC